MAFDMYLGKTRAKIDHHEEAIFDFVNENDAFPELGRIWEQYYDNPRISPVAANDLVHELIDLRERLVRSSEHHHLADVITRLLPFFSAAYRSGDDIKCVSD